MHRWLILDAVSAVWVASEIALVFLRHSHKSESRDRMSLHVLWICIGGSIAAGSMVRRVPATLMPARDALFFAGTALIVIGIAIRWAAVFTLGRFFTVDVAIRDGHRVVSHGLYGVVRHPMYLGSYVSFIGLGFAFGNWLSLAIIAVATALAFAYRISVEERALTGALGDEYRAYATHTKRFIPGVF